MVTLTSERFGQLSDGQEVDLYRWRTAAGFEVAITNFGGRVVSIDAPDRAGVFADVVLGFDNLAGYTSKNPYFGALVGRYANRIANGRFTLGGETYQLPVNNPPNTLHGGVRGFDSVLWTASQRDTPAGPVLDLRYESRDGEEGFPGNLEAHVTYSVSGQNALRIEFRAETDKKTVLNLTNHSYFDLSGAGKGNILDHIVTIAADRFVVVDEELIPTGELAAVKGTPFDFRTPHRVGDRIDADNEQLKRAIGYDHTLVLDNADATEPQLAARAVDPASGRVLEVLTTQPGVHFYTGNHLDGTVTGKGGAVYNFRTGLCLETQHFADSPNHPEFPSTVLDPGATYRVTTVFRFGVDGN